MKWNKIFGLIAIIVLMILLILYIFPWKNKINTTIQGVQCRIGEKNFVEDISITIDGDYKRYLFMDDIFYGTISIDNYEFTSDGSNVSLKFNKGKSFLIYMNVIDGKPIQVPLGAIYCTPNFKQFLICISEPVHSDSNRWNADLGLFISAPSLNRSQAIDIAKNLAEKNIADLFK